MAVAFQKKTLRRMSPTTRKVARLTGEALSVAKRFKNLVPDIQRLELDSQALATAKQPDRFGFSPEEWQDIRNAIDAFLTAEANRAFVRARVISDYQSGLLQSLVDKLRK